MHKSLGEVVKQENKVSFGQVGANRLRHNLPQSALSSLALPVGNDSEGVETVEAKLYEGQIPSVHIGVTAPQEQRHTKALVKLFVGDDFQHVALCMPSEASTAPK